MEISSLQNLLHPKKPLSAVFKQVNLRERRELFSLSTDTGPCKNCWREFHDPKSSRYHYPFIRCEHCGPKKSDSIHSAPCRTCRKERDTPSHRRFGEEAISCSKCGPRLHFFDVNGENLDIEDTLCAAGCALDLGKILAVKVWDSYQLVCEAENERTVASLRVRKQQSEKPFSILVANVADAKKYCKLSRAEEKILLSPDRPILMAKALETTTLAASVRKGSPLLGVMLPSSPLHYLLLREVDDEPLIVTDFSASADFFLTPDFPQTATTEECVLSRCGMPYKEIPPYRERFV